jgi:hypothetical protein
VLEGLMTIQRKIAQEKALQTMKTNERAAATWKPVHGPIIVRGEYAPRFAEKKPW